MGVSEEIARLKQALQQMPATGDHGFEGLIAVLLSALTGDRYYVARSGDQPADAVSGAGSIAVQTKRYLDSTSIDETDFEGDYSKACRSFPNLDCYVFAATRVSLALLLLVGLHPWHAGAAGVTLITHGFMGDVDEWIVPMAGKITEYYRFPGSTSSCYEIYFVENAQGNYVPAQRRFGGIPATNTLSGEIIVKLDWSQLAGSILGGVAYSTTNIAPAFASALLSTNFIPELGGRALAEMPLHLIGHSRGGSMMCEITRILGAQGVWVDHLTTLDPHPLNNDGFDDSIITSVVDGPALAYVNVLFADNYYQPNNSIFGFDPSGKHMVGAYNRYLSNLTGGYGQAHSDVHLWYHGTIDLVTPATDTQATITAAERQSWWTVQEGAGVYAGFHWSLLGRGDRLSPAEPAGAGTGSVRDGYNKIWDFGAGVDSNRYALPSNNGLWPNLIRLNLTSTNVVAVGATNHLTYLYQYGAASEPTCLIELYLDDDLNPFNGNLGIIAQHERASTGITGIGTGSIQWIPNAQNVPPGTYAIYGRITANGRQRYLYAQEILQLEPSLAPPTLDLEDAGSNQFRITVHGFTGQRIILQASSDLTSWTPIGTNVLAGTEWELLDQESGGHERRFYRATVENE